MVSTDYKTFVQYAIRGDITINRITMINKRSVGFVKDLVGPLCGWPVAVTDSLEANPSREQAHFWRLANSARLLDCAAS